MTHSDIQTLNESLKKSFRKDVNLYAEILKRCIEIRTRQKEIAEFRKEEAEATLRAMKKSEKEGKKRFEFLVRGRKYIVTRCDKSTPLTKSNRATN